MARSSNADLLKNYRTKLSQTKRMRKQEQFDDTWKRMLDLYRGRHYENYSDEDRLLVNMAFSTINVIAPSVSVNHPKITVSARRPEDADKATVTEAIVNYWWRHYGCQPQFRSAVKDFLIFGHGWIKVGYRFVEEERVKNADPNVEHNDVVDLVPESNMETELVVLEDRPFIERISPFDMFVDPDATTMQDVRWIAQRIKRPLVDVKNDRRYNSAARSEAQPSLYSKYGEDTQAKQPYGEELDSYVEVWEWYDIPKKTMAVFCNGPDKFLIAPTKIPFSFGHPFTMLRNYEVPEHFYPMGELEAIESLQHELNATRTQMMNHRKRFSRKWLYKESAFDTTAISYAGAQGLLQLMPVTLERFGVTNPNDPVESLKGGVKYLQYLDKFWLERVPETNERIKFILASYTIGQGHVDDAWRLTLKYRKNTQSWQEVSNFLNLKSDPKYYRDPVVKSGYAKGHIAVKYVRDVLALFQSYKDLVDP